MKASVIIPTKDRLSKIKKVVQLLNQQNRNDFEIIVINDGEKTPSLVSKKTLKIYNSSKRGVSVARNIGIKKATGGILIFLGDDTYPHYNFVSEHISFHNKYINSNYAMLGYVKWYKKIGDKLIYDFLDKGIQFDFGSLKQNKSVDVNHFYTANLSIKKSFIELFDEKMSKPYFEDIELAQRLSRKGLKLIYNPKAVVEHDHVYNEEMLANKAFNSGTTTKLLEESSFIGRSKYRFSTLDKFKYYITKFLKRNKAFRMKYYHFLFITNFVKGYGSN